MAEQAADPGFGTITEAALAALKGRVGKELRHLKRRATVTDEWIERYAFAIGDQNPLWTDARYAARGPMGGLLAPPTMVYVLSGWDIGTGLPGVHALFVRSRIEWRAPIRVGDRLDSVGTLHEITERPSRFAGQAVLQGTETLFTNQRREEVAVARNYNLRTERGEANRRGTLKAAEKQRYSRADLRRIEGETFRETIRGDLPRPWASVAVGDALPGVVKGPLTVTDMVSYMRGGFGGIAHGFFMYTHGFGTAFRRRHPGAVIWTDLGIPDSPESVHWNDDCAQKSGLAAAYDLGPQRIAWMAQVVTNWMGDHGALRMIDVNLRKIVLMADTIWCGGRVIGKERAEGRGCVRIALEAVNQRGEVLADGIAIAELPE